VLQCLRRRCPKLGPGTTLVADGGFGHWMVVARFEGLVDVGLGSANSVLVCGHG